MHFIWWLFSSKIYYKFIFLAILISFVFLTLERMIFHSILSKTNHIVVDIWSFLNIQCYV